MQQQQMQQQQMQQQQMQQQQMQQQQMQQQQMQQQQMQQQQMQQQRMQQQRMQQQRMQQMQQQQMQQQQMQRQISSNKEDDKNIFKMNNLETKVMELEKKLKKFNKKEKANNNTEIIRKLMSKIKLLEKDHDNKIKLLEKNNELKIKLKDDEFLQLKTVESNLIKEKNNLNEELDNLKEKNKKLKNDIDSVKLEFSSKTPQEMIKLIKTKYEDVNKNNKIIENRKLEYDNKEKELENKEIEFNKKLKEFENKEKEFNNKKLELDQLENRLNLMSENNKVLDFELKKKKKILDDILEKYQNEIEKVYLQMEISSDSESEFVHNFREIQNISAIKLLSYSLPDSIYNIDNNNNNLVLKTKENNDIIVKIVPGNYKIENLLEKLNKNLEQHKITFELNDTQKIIVKSNDQKEFMLQDSILLNKVLGFNNFSEYKDNFLSENIWDLRSNNKLYIYIDNIRDNVPFGIIYFDNIVSSEIKFEDGINLSHFKIRILDSNNNLYDFNNLKYSLNFQFEITNKVSINLDDVV
jgi:hypothetical protein